MPKCPEIIKNHPIFSTVWLRCWNRNQNFNMVATGPPGSGKSYAMLSFLWQVCRDPEGNPLFNENYIVFTAKDFINLVKNDELAKPGHGILWDEPGVTAGAAARAAMTKGNQAISDVAQTVRERRLVLAYATPSLSFLDKNVRMLFHASVEMKNPGYGNFRWWEFSGETGQIYKKIPSVRGKYGVIYKKGVVAFPMPPRKIRRVYEKRKRESTDSWYEKYSSFFEKQEQKYKEKKFLEAYEVVKAEWVKYWLPNAKEVDRAALEMDYKMLPNSQLVSLRSLVKEQGRLSERQEKEKKKAEDSKREYADDSQFIN